MDDDRPLMQINAEILLILVPIINFGNIAFFRLQGKNNKI